MPFNLKTWICAFALGILLDFVWIGLIAKNFYLRELAPIGRIVDGKFEAVYWAAAMVYVLIGLGISFFVLPLSSSIGDAALKGALFGLVCYGVYDFTNYSTLKDWTLKMALIDITWGTFLGAVVSSATYWLGQKF